MKKGFTLIELMVVIVIIGILAAIAVPKMFGMSAKAKAAEVMPAYGSWSKVAQAYALESGLVGDFISIGYQIPGASSGTLVAASPAAAAASPTQFWYASAPGTFGAINKYDLNNCTAGTFSATPAVASNTWYAIFNTSGVVTPTDPTSPGCSVLTPSFTPN